MDIKEIILNSLGWFITFAVGYYFFKKNARQEKEDKREQAREDVVKALYDELSKNNNLNPEVLMSIAKSRYRRSKIDPFPEDEWIIIIDDAIYGIREDPFIPTNKKMINYNSLNILRTSYTKVERNLAEAVSQWKKSSIFLVALQVIAQLCLGIGAGGLIVILSLLLTQNIGNIYLQLILVSIIAIFASIVQFRNSWKIREQRSKTLGLTLEDNVYEVIKEILPDSKIERGVNIRPDSNLTRFDMLIKYNNIEIPVEIRQGNLTKEVIIKLSKSISDIKLKYAILVSSSIVNTQLHQDSLSRNILIVDNVETKEEIKKQLKNLTSLFEIMD